MNDSNRGSKDIPTKVSIEEQYVAQRARQQASKDGDTLIPLHIAFQDIGAKNVEAGSEEENLRGRSRMKNSSECSNAIGIGRKDDSHKPRWDLLDAEFLDGIAAVLEFGSRKYDAHNWRGGITVSRLLAALGRHFGAILRGKDIDPESGLPHWAHLGCCLMFFSWMITHRKDLDNRYKY